MNFSGIASDTLVGRVLRLPFKLIPKGAIFPILQGKLQGRKWIVGSSNHGCWLGSYEYRKRLLFEKTVAEGDCVFDIGANVGFYTLLASALVGRRGHVFAFEPEPSNIAYLKKHVKINGVQNVRIIEAAVSDHDGQGHFERGIENTEGKLSDSGALVVNCVDLDRMISDAGLYPPNVIKIDVEGGELEVLRGSTQLLAAHHPTIFLAT